MGSKRLAHANEDVLSKAYPEGIRWDINIPNITITQMIDEAIIKYGDHNAMDFMGKKTSYTQLGRMINHAAKGLQEMGVKPGDKVGLYMPNTSYYPIMLLAAIRIGAVAVNFGLELSEEQLREQVNNSDTDILVTLNLTDFQANARGLLDSHDIKKVVTCPLADALPFTKGVLYRAFKSKTTLKHDIVNDDNVHFLELIHNDGIYEPTIMESKDAAIFQFTGGSTGIPKNAVLSHSNIVANCYQIQEFYMQSKDKPAGVALQPGQEKVLAAIPYFHIFGLTVAMLGSLSMGNELVILPNPRDIKRLIKTINNEHPRLAPLIPRLQQAIAEHPMAGKNDLSSMDFVISGGAALPPNIKEAFEAVVGKEDIIKQGYGLSETSPFAAANPPYGTNKFRSVGLACPRTEIKIVDPEDTDKTLEIDEIGEILIKGPQVMQGYYKREKETKDVLSNDGWFSTGDLGYMDEDYYIHIADRSKRLIIVNGENVYPNQVEEVINGHEDVAECIVISVPDDRSGETGKAFIRFKDGVTPPAEDDIRAFLKEKLNRAQMPKHLEYRTEELPKTAVGKPDWNKLQQEERAKIDNETGGTDTPKPPQP